MRVRVLFTNGVRTVDLFWLSHDGKDVYCGQPGFDEKRSYHDSGKVHSTTGGKRTHEGWHAPLAQVERQFHLRTIAFVNSANVFADVAESHVYSGRKSDAVLVIDSRSIPEGKQVNVSIGLLEPGNTDVLRSMILAPSHVGIEAKQVLLSTAVNPWVYVVAYWLEERFFSPLAGGG